MPERFHRAVVREPEGNGERMVVGRATKALAVRMATKEAERCGWDWVVMHCEEIPKDEDGREFRVIEQWSSLAGHEIIDECT